MSPRIACNVGYKLKRQNEEGDETDAGKRLLKQMQASPSVSYRRNGRRRGSKRQNELNFYTSVFVMLL